MIEYNNYYMTVMYSKYIFEKYSNTYSEYKTTK